MGGGGGQQLKGADAGLGTVKHKCTAPAMYCSARTARTGSHLYCLIKCTAPAMYLSARTARTGSHLYCLINEPEPEADVHDVAPPAGADHGRVVHHQRGLPPHHHRLACMREGKEWGDGDSAEGGTPLSAQMTDAWCLRGEGRQVSGRRFPQLTTMLSYRTLRYPLSTPNSSAPS